MKGKRKFITEKKGVEIIKANGAGMKVERGRKKKVDMTLFENMEIVSNLTKVQISGKR